MHACVLQKTFLMVLTGPPSELQQFILLHATYPDAWDEDDERLHRLR
jgi:hypothetical protein